MLRPPRLLHRSHILPIHRKFRTATSAIRRLHIRITLGDLSLVQLHENVVMAVDHAVGGIPHGDDAMLDPFGCPRNPAMIPTVAEVAIVERQPHLMLLTPARPLHSLGS